MRTGQRGPLLDAGKGKRGGIIRCGARNTRMNHPTLFLFAKQRVPSRLFWNSSSRRRAAAAPFCDERRFLAMDAEAGANVRERKKKQSPHRAQN
mmetsp:Transcript_9731/g.29078  ORF Transcript_9731/g.29078 Transcript_9731/m.29078 type:complete len:94 (+) Transcript_9731:360-641(+)